VRKLIVSAVAVTGFAFAGMALASGDGTGMAGSPHDFSDNVVAGVTNANYEVDGAKGGWNAREEICRVCHVPHDHGNVGKYWENKLLWNHKVSSATYTMYDSTWSPSIDGAQDSAPSGTAILCLGCHDGTVAIDTFDKYAGGSVQMSDYDGGFEVPRFMDGVNEDLRGTHPLSITYDPVADTGLNATTTYFIGSSGDTIADVLDGGKVQCSSCHDVHDQDSVANTHLLRQGTTAATGGASALCLVCHNK